MEKHTDGQRLDYDSEESKYIPTFTIIYIYFFFQSRNMNKKAKPFRRIGRSTDIRSDGLNSEHYANHKRTYPGISRNYTNF